MKKYIPTPEEWEQWKNLGYYPYPRFHCHCPCKEGVEVKNYHKRYGIPIYISGHNSGKCGPISREKRICSSHDCNSIFECRVDSKKKYCSKSCARKKLPKLKVCAHSECNNTFESLPYMTKEYCSNSCAHKKVKEEGICAYENCANVFLVRPSDERIYCSRSCRNLAIWSNPAYRESLKVVHKDLWDNMTEEEKEYRVKKILRANIIRPNKAEQFLYGILQELFPGEYKYVGNGEFILGGKNPDFVNINGQKKIIEMFGDFWHGRGRTGRTKEEEENQRIDFFNRYGYETFIVWQHQLEKPDLLIHKLKVFCEG